MESIIELLIDLSLAGSERAGVTVRSGGRQGGPNTAATNIQAGWRGYNTRNKDNQVE